MLRHRSRSRPSTPLRCSKQQMLRKRIIGDRFWWHVSKKRKAAFPGMTDIYDILKDDEAFNQTISAPAGCSSKRMPYQIKQQLRHLGNEEWSRYVSATDAAESKRRGAREDMPSHSSR